MKMVSSGNPEVKNPNLDEDSRNFDDFIENLQQLKQSVENQNEVSDLGSILNLDFVNFLRENPDKREEIKDTVVFLSDKGKTSSQRREMNRIAKFLDNIEIGGDYEKSYKKFLSYVIRRPKRLNDMNKSKVNEVMLYVGMHEDDAVDLYKHMKNVHGKEDELGLLKTDKRNFNMVWSVFEKCYSQSELFIGLDYKDFDKLSSANVSSLKNFLGEDVDWDGNDITEKDVPDPVYENSIVKKDAVAKKFNELNQERIKNNEKRVSEITVGFDTEISHFTKDSTGTTFYYDGVEFTEEKLMEIFGDQIKKEAGIIGVDFVSEAERDELIDKNLGTIYDKMLAELKDVASIQVQQAPNGQQFNQGQQYLNGQQQNNPQGPQNPSQGPLNPSQGPQNPSQGPQNPSQGPQNPSQLNQGQPTLSQAPQQVLSSDFETELSDDKHKNISQGLIKKIENLEFCDKYDANKTKFNISKVKEYLDQNVKNKNWSDFRNLERNADPAERLKANLWIIAVQIALTYLNESTDADGKPLKSEFNGKCDVQGLDGFFGSDTRTGVKGFQSAWNEKYKTEIAAGSKTKLDEDQLPGPKTVEAILGELDVVEQSPLNITPNSGVRVSAGGSLKPEELLQGFDPNTMTAEFDTTNGGPDFKTVGNHNVDVIVKDINDPTKVITVKCTYEVYNFTIGAKSGCEFYVGQALSPDMLLDYGFNPGTMTAEFDTASGASNFNSKGLHNVNVIVKDKSTSSVIQTVSCSYEVVDFQPVAKQGIVVMLGEDLHPEDLLVNTPNGAKLTGNPETTYQGNMNVKVYVPVDGGNSVEVVCNYTVVNVASKIYAFIDGSELDLSELTLLDIAGADLIVNGLDGSRSVILNLNGLEILKNGVAGRLSSLKGNIMIDKLLDNSDGKLVDRLNAGLLDELKKLAPASGDLTILAQSQAIVDEVKKVDTNNEVKIDVASSVPLTGPINLDFRLNRYSNGADLDLSSITTLDKDGAQKIANKLNGQTGVTVKLNGINNMDVDTASELSKVNGTIEIDGILDAQSINTKIQDQNFVDVLKNLAPATGTLEIKVSDPNIVAAVQSANLNIKLSVK